MRNHRKLFEAQAYLSKGLLSFVEVWRFRSYKFAHNAGRAHRSIRTVSFPVSLTSSR